MALNASPSSPTGSSSSIQPSEITLRRLQSMAGTVDLEQDTSGTNDELPVVPVQDGEQILLEVEDDLTEQQLRELYDSEEIDRFLNLFSAYVTEVRLPETSSPTKSKTREPSINVNEIRAEPKLEQLDEGEWVAVNDTPQPIVENAPPTALPAKYLSEYIARRFIVPALPPAPLPPPLFTFGRLRVTTQRLYLAVEPAYKPFFANLTRLATWKDRRQSSIYCAIFWSLWWYNLLLPALFLRIFFALIRRKVFPYPTLRELRKRRQEVARANEFGDAVQARLAPSSPFGFMEVWRLFKVFNKPKVAKAKNAVKEKGKEKNKGSAKPDGNEQTKPALQESEDTATVLDDTKETKQETDGKRAILQIFTDIADVHERIKNIFIWRRPGASYVYGGVIFFLFLVTLLLPAKYISKLSYAVGGILFWHITPVIAALPPADRAKLPPAFNDVPTDSDYAMELISQRVASGLDVKPTALKKPKRAKTQNLETTGEDAIKTGTDGKPVDWKKWGDRAALGKSWADDGKRLFTGGEWRQTGTWPPRNPLMPEPVLLHGVPAPRIETHTFPAQHTSAPGLITLTPTIIYFTPLMSTTAKVTIPFSDLRGVKKTGLLKGLSLRWADTQEDGNTTEKEEKFIWVGDRDELFARLIGPDGRRWLRV